MTARRSRQRTIIVGDVHGCIDELDDLLTTCSYKRSRDRLVFVGDLIAKGPDSLAVVRRARELKALAVRGNHEAQCVTWWRAKRRGDSLPDLKKSQRQVIESLKESDFRWMNALPLWLRLNKFGVIVVHAGLIPGVPLKRQDPEALVNMRAIDKDGRGTKYYDQGTPWTKLWKGPETIVFGHDSTRGLQKHTFSLGLDTGCVYGGKLSALLLPANKIVSVNAHKSYRELS